MHDAQVEALVMYISLKKIMSVFTTSLMVNKNLAKKLAGHRIHFMSPVVTVNELKALKNTLLKSKYFQKWNTSAIPWE